MRAVSFLLVIVLVASLGLPMAAAHIQSGQGTLMLDQNNHQGDLIGPYGPPAPPCELPPVQPDPDRIEPAPIHYC